MRCVYGLTDPRTGKIHYVGATRLGHSRPSANWTPSALAVELNEAKRMWLEEVREIGTPGILILERIDSPKPYDLGAAEKRWILALREQGHPLTNISPGGDGFPGYVHSADTRRKISEAKQGVPRSPADRAKMSASHLTRDRSPEELEQITALGRGWKGKTRSPETRAKMSAAKQGRPRSPETIAKVAAALRGRTLNSEQRAKLSQALTGKVRSPETRAKMSEAKRKYWAERKAAQVP
jgi:hypothetical protein